MTCQCPNETSNTCKYLDVSVSVGVFHGFCQLSLSVSWPVSRWRSGQKCPAAVISGDTLLTVACEYCWRAPSDFVCPRGSRVQPILGSDSRAHDTVSVSVEIIGNISEDMFTPMSRYGSHHARSLETSWWIGNKNCQILRRTHSKLCYMQLSWIQEWTQDAVKFHTNI